MTPDDIDYIRTHFLSLDEVCLGRSQPPQEVRALIAAGALPAPTYRLPDGSEMVPKDYFALVDAAGGPQQLLGWFSAELRAAARAQRRPLSDGAVEHEWRGYLSGHYGACLREVSPANIVAKAALIERIEQALRQPRPTEPAWKADLRNDVDALDTLERKFTTYDRQRFGGSVSRDRCIDVPRRRYPEVFASSPAD